MASRLMYEVRPLWGCEGSTDVQLCVFVSDTCFDIYLSAANFQGNPTLLKEYLYHVKQLGLELGSQLSTDLVEDPVEEIYKWATIPFTPLFHDVPPLDRKRRYTIQDCLFSRQLTYTLGFVRDRLEPVKMENITRNRLVGALFPASKELYKSIFPVFYPLGAGFTDKARDSIHAGGQAITLYEYNIKDH